MPLLNLLTSREASRRIKGENTSWLKFLIAELWNSEALVWHLPSESHTLLCSCLWTYMGIKKKKHDFINVGLKNDLILIGMKPRKDVSVGSYNESTKKMLLGSNEEDKVRTFMGGGISI